MSTRTEGVLGDVAAMARLRQELADLYGFAWIGGDLHYHAADAPRRVLRRCLVCNPWCFSRPLAIDGREYRRRQQARRRRGR